MTSVVTNLQEGPRLKIAQDPETENSPLPRSCGVEACTSAELPDATKQTKNRARLLLATPQCRLAFSVKHINSVTVRMFLFISRVYRCSLFVWQEINRSTFFKYFSDTNLDRVVSRTTVLLLRFICRGIKVRYTGEHVSTLLLWSARNTSW